MLTSYLWNSCATLVLPTLLEDEQRLSVEELLTDLNYQNLGRQFLHNYIKYKHQHSGRGLLLTISTSVGNYLYAGEISVKKHFMSRETHSSVQGKMCNYIQGSNGPLNSLT